jgi:hypothetical protein
VFNLSENTFFYPKLLRRAIVPSVGFVVVVSIGLCIGIRYGTAEVVELFALLLLFGEFGLGRLLRIWWMINEFENLHRECVRWLHEGHWAEDVYDAEPIRLLSEYECIKSRGGVRAKDKLFERLNRKVSTEWEQRSNAMLRDMNQRIAHSPATASRTSATFF